MSGSVIVDSDLTGIDLTGASMNRCLWQDVTFDHAKLDGADLKGAILRRSSGRHTTFSQAQLRAAEIDHATLTSIPEVRTGPVVDAPRSPEESVLGDNKMFKAAPVTDVSIVRVFYATDRKPGPDGFGPDRDDRLRYGVCDVSIPRDHRMGELEAPSADK
jgi:hypothetical protein